MPTMDAYAEAIRTKVCSVCIERTGRGICGLGAWDDCALNRYLNDVVIIVNSMHDAPLHERVQELHSVICVSCRDNPDGLCKLRASLDCSLDQYFPLIVEAISDVNAQTAH